MCRSLIVEVFYHNVASSSVFVLHSCVGFSHPARIPVLLQVPHTNLWHIPASGPRRRPLVVSTCNFCKYPVYFFSVFVSSFIWFYFDIQLLLMRDSTKVTFYDSLLNFFASAFICGSGFLRQARPRRRAKQKDVDGQWLAAAAVMLLVCRCFRHPHTGLASELCGRSPAARCCTWQTCTCI